MHINEDKSSVGSRFRVGRWIIFFRTRLRFRTCLWWAALVLLVPLVQLVWPTPPAGQASQSGDKLVVSVWRSNHCFLTNVLILIFSSLIKLNAQNSISVVVCLFCISQAKNQIFFARVKSSARVKRVPRPIFGNFKKNMIIIMNFLRGGGGQNN